MKRIDRFILVLTDAVEAFKMPPEEIDDHEDYINPNGYNNAFGICNFVHSHELFSNVQYSTYKKYMDILFDHSWITMASFHWPCQKDMSPYQLTLMERSEWCANRLKELEDEKVNS
jgi:hypothetical protein